VTKHIEVWEAAPTSRRIEWIEQVRAALEELRAFPCPVIDRTVLERVLRIERCTAIRLMNQFGAYQTGRTFLIDRVNDGGPLARRGGRIRRILSGSLQKLGHSISQLRMDL
jgi:hypothetical protein